MKPSNKIDWTPEMVSFLRNNWTILTNKAIANHLGLKLSTVRGKLYELGLKRIDLEYWSDEQVACLKSLYQTMGDLEISENFNRLFPKQKGWTLKHIEKKRLYLGLKRTPDQLKAIKKRNKEKGCWALCAKKRWDKTGRAKEGEIRYWERIDGAMIPYVKINGRFIHWARWAYSRNIGPIPKKMNVAFADGNYRNLDINNLILLTNAQQAARNAQKSSVGLSDNYVLGIMTIKDETARVALKGESDIIEFKRQQLLLNRKIHEKQNKRSA